MNLLVNALIKSLKKNNLTLALAESVTCGMASAALGNGPGTADVFKGSIVCYSPDVKMKLLNVSKANIKKYTCESHEVTMLLSKHLRQLIKADIYAAVTGLASEGGSETKTKPVGTVFFCILKNNRTYSYKKLYKGSPLQIKKKACKELYQLILKTINK